MKFIDLKRAYEYKLFGKDMALLIESTRLADKRKIATRHITELEAVKNITESIEKVNTLFIILPTLLAISLLLLNIAYLCKQ